jgi:hypothetical protein
MTDSVADLIEKPIRQLPEFGGGVPPFETPEKPIISPDVKFEPMIGAVVPDINPITRRDLTPPPLSPEEKQLPQKEGVLLINDLAWKLKALGPEGVNAAANTLSNLLFSAEAQKGETGSVDEAKRVSDERAKKIIEDIVSVSPLNSNPLTKTA